MATEISLGQLLSKYSNFMELSGKSSSIRPTSSAVVRIIVPMLGGQEPLGKRAKESEISEALQFLSHVPASAILSVLNDIDDWFDQKGITPTQRRSDKSRIRAFVKWAFQEIQSQEKIDLNSTASRKSKRSKNPKNAVTDLSNKQSSKDTIISGFSRNGRQSPHRFRPQNRRFKSPNGTRRQYARNLQLRGKNRTQAYTLGCQQFNDYIVDTSGNRVLANSQLQLDFTQFGLYMCNKLNLRPATVKKNIDHLRGFYGWLHRYKTVPLAELAFREQVPVIQLYHPLEDCLDETGLPSFQIKVVNEAIAKDKAKVAARRLIDLFREYLAFTNGAASSDCSYIGAMLNVAKFLYQDVTDREQYDDFQDISFVMQLRLLRRERDVPEEPVVAREKKSLPWPEVLKVMEHLRAEADTEYLEGYYGPNKENFYSHRREDRWIAKSLLKFLILAFLCIIPPHRSRTIQELEIGVTMLRGAMVDGEFIDADLLDDPSTAGWWLYLPPEKIKTGQQYGPYWSELPNIQFADHTCFYDYIDRWLNEYRYCFPTTHNRFFTRHSGKPVTAQSLWEYVRDFFMRITGVPMGPQQLRSSFVTYLYDIGVPDYELDAVAFSMHHTRRMQESHYRKQKQIKRTRVAVARSVELVETIIGLRSNSVRSK